MTGRWADKSMALARKGTRRIVVADIPYRWTVAPDDEPGVGIVVEAFDHPACRLVSWVEHGVVVSPGLVRRAILEAREAGWRPDVPGADFVRRVPAFSETREAIHQCPACDYFTLPTRAQYDICPVCFWEDDGMDIDRLDQISGPNHLTLREARRNFREIGACAATYIEQVLPADSRSRFRCAPR
jgi:hypothetical protein